LPLASDPRKACAARPAAWQTSTSGQAIDKTKMCGASVSRALKRSGVEISGRFASGTMRRAGSNNVRVAPQPGDGRPAGSWRLAKVIAEAAFPAVPRSRAPEAILENPRPGPHPKISINDIQNGYFLQSNGGALNRTNYAHLFLCGKIAIDRRNMVNHGSNLDTYGIPFGYSEGEECPSLGKQAP